jgi:hypothetical protein
MFVELPDADVAQGARWRIFRQRITTVAFREETTIDATAVNAGSFTLDRKSKFAPPPTGASSGSSTVGSLEGSLVSHFELATKNLIPTVTAAYDAALDLNGPNGKKRARQHVKVSIRPL